MTVLFNDLIWFDLFNEDGPISWKLIGGFSSKVREIVATTTATTENKEGKMKVKIQIDEKESRNKSNKRVKKWKTKNETKIQVQIDSDIFHSFVVEKLSVSWGNKLLRGI